MYHLTLPIEKEYRIAVAANTRKQQISSGIVWSSYEVIKNNNGKVVNIRVAERESRKQQDQSGMILRSSDNINNNNGKEVNRAITESESYQHSSSIRRLICIDFVLWACIIGMFFSYNRQ